MFNIAFHRPMTRPLDNPDGARFVAEGFLLDIRRSVATRPGTGAELALAIEAARLQFALEVGPEQLPVFDQALQASGLSDSTPLAAPPADRGLATGLREVTWTVLSRNTRETRKYSEDYDLQWAYEVEGVVNVSIGGRCLRCGVNFEGTLSARASGIASQDANNFWGFPRRDVHHGGFLPKAEAQARRDALKDAGLTLSMVRCPGCGERPQGVARESVESMGCAAIMLLSPMTAVWLARWLFLRGQVPAAVLELSRREEWVASLCFVGLGLLLLLGGLDLIGSQVETRRRARNLALRVL